MNEVVNANESLMKHEMFFATVFEVMVRLSPILMTHGDDATVGML